MKNCFLSTGFSQCWAGGENHHGLRLQWYYRSLTISELSPYLLPTWFLKKKTIVGTRNPSRFTDSGKSTLWHLQSASAAETKNPTQCQLEFVSAASQPINCTSPFPRLQSDELNLGLRIWPLQISRAFARSQARIMGSKMAPFHLTDDGNFLV